MRFKSLQHTILLKIALPVLTLMLVLVLTTTDQVSNSLYDAIQQRVDDAATHMAQRAGAKVGLVRQACEAVAENDVLVNAIVDVDQRESILKPFFRTLRLPGARDQQITMTDYRGRPITSTARGQQPNFSQERWYRRVMRGESLVEVSETTLLVAAPVRYAGRTEAAVVVTFPLADFLEDLAPRSRDEVTVFDFDDVVVASTNPELIPSNQAFQTPDRWLHASANVPGLNRVRATRLESERSSLSTLHTVRKSLFGQTTVVGLGLLGSIWLASRLTTRALSALLREIDRIMHTGDLSGKVDESGPQEFAELGARFNLMISQLEQTTVSREKYRVSEQQLDLALINANIGLFDWDTATDQVYYSATAKTQLGFPADAPWNSFVEWESRLHPDDREEAMQRVEDYIQRRLDHYESSYRLRDAEGSYRWILSRGKAIWDQSDKPVRVVGVNIDVTEQRTTAQQLQLTQYAVDTSADAVFFLRPDGSINYANQQASHYLGYSRSELAEMTIGQIDSQLSEHHWPGYWEQAKATSLLELESRHLRKDGTYYDCEFRVRFLKLGNVELIVATVRDITENKNSETALRQADEELKKRTGELEQIFEAIPLAMLYADEQRRISRVNPAFTRIFGFTEDEVL
ncbi:MAG: PAS domain S-box protein, partial [Pirellulales bacterium]|nr:PAS domain S-box protein [Pirellulales bacterium]